MRIPWSTPTVSDATKLGAYRYAGDEVVKGECLTQLLLQPIVAEAFANLSAWTESDSTGSNVYVSGGKLYMNGSNAWNANGVVFTAGFARKLTEVYVKMTIADANVQCSFGVHTGTLPTSSSNAANGANGQYGTATIRTTIGGVNTTFTVTAGVTYELKLRYDPSSLGTYIRCRAYIKGGTEWPGWTLIFDSWAITELGATAYPYLQRYTNSAGALTEFSEFKIYQNFATDGPYLTYVADAGAGKTFGGFDPTNLAAVGGWATTNAKFQYSYDDGTPAYNGSWLTLAQLNAETALTTSKRYIRLLVQANSDGATQQYVGEVNADDATSMPAGGGGGGGSNFNGGFN